VHPLHRQLEQLDRTLDVRARVAADPVAFVHRYRTRDDVEIAGLVAATLAFGRVDLFRPILARIFDAIDAGGGPRAFVDRFVADDGVPFADHVYRWTRGGDHVLLFLGLRDVLTTHGSLEALFDVPGTLRERLVHAVDVLRDAVVEAARREGADVGRFEDLSLGLRHLLPSPAQGSACKRWHLWLRWMVRPPTDGVDLGVWSVLRPSDLIVPLDTHVGRIARFVGLTERKDTSWRTAEEVTDGLRRFDADDPVRFDFALAHLGISGACLGRRVDAVCATCPLTTVCTAPR
jgi:uncharacterized protein (TIGR02757 family)